MGFPQPPGDPRAIPRTPVVPGRWGEAGACGELLVTALCRAGTLRPQAGQVGMFKVVC